MEEKNKNSLFREKSLEAIQSPESLNDYLHVTSPGVWFVMAAVILLLVGLIAWSVFGQIETHAEVAVVCRGGKSVCCVPYSLLEQAKKQGSVRVNGQECALLAGSDVQVVTVTEDMNPYVMIAGRLSVGDVVAQVPLEAQLEDDVYTGILVTDSLKPITLLLR